MKKNAIPLVETLLLGMALVSIIAIQLIFQRPPFGDEKDYLSDVALINKYGFGKTYLVNLAGSAGPLYSLVHFLFEPITGLQAPYIRWINIGLLAGAIFFIYQVLNLVNPECKRFAFYIMAFPMTFVISGLALTEMPALFFFSAAIFFIIKANRTISVPKKLLQLLIGALCMSFAIIGRQPYLLTLIALPVLFIDKENHVRNILFLLITLIVSLSLPIYVFGVWHGLVPTIESKLYKDIAASGVSYRFDFFVLCLFYFAVCMLLAAPFFFRLKLSKGTIKALVVSGIVLAAANFTFHWIELLPLRWLLEKVFVTPGLSAIVSTLIGTVVILSGLFFLFCACKQFFFMKHGKESLFFVLSLLLIAFACTKITWGYSSRYAGQAIPSLILAGSFFYRPSRFNVIRITTGIAIGIVSLVSYFQSAS